ncbi:hypothetical protein BTA51_08415 [Hahella sp. CCB-MM4]|nr:hypothetical protein BTA51_08415 [Hahella sp. CCB-MM4]
MKTTFWILFFLSVSFCAPAENENDDSSSIHVTVAVNNAPPYRIIDGTRVSGLYIDIFNALAERLQWQVIYEEVPFPRALHMMRYGQADIMLGPMRRPEREVFMDYSIPAFPPERKLFLVNDPKEQIHSYEDLYGKIIGTLRGSAYFLRFDKDEQLQKVEGNNYATLLRMLAYNRVDTVVIPELLAVALQKELGLSFTASPYTVPGETSYIALSRKSGLRARMKEIKQALDQMKEDHTYDSLLDKYH